MRALLVLVCLFALARSASAEGAWVLWFQQTWIVPNRSIEPEPWLLLNAAPDYPGCKSLQTERVKGATSPKPASVEITKTESGASVVVWMAFHSNDGGLVNQVLRYMCLPDTVDPRGPKGK